MVVRQKDLVFLRVGMKGEVLGLVGLVGLVGVVEFVRFSMVGCW